MFTFLFNGILITLSIYIGTCAFYYFFQEKLIFVPWGTKKVDSPVVLASQFEEVFLEGIEGGRIHAIHIKAKNPRGCILYFHGNTGGISRWGAIAEELVSFGFDIFLPDYRGYGKSRGLRTEATLYSDAMLCYKFILTSYPEEKICLYGRSLGSGIASWLSSKSKPGALILETPYSSMTDVAKYHSKIIPVKLFLRYTFNSGLFLKLTEAPILIAHGTKDNLVPYKSGLKLYNSLRQRDNVQMLTIPGGKHGNLNGFPVFRDTLQEFFDRYFPRAL